MPKGVDHPESPRLEGARFAAYRRLYQQGLREDDFAPSLNCECTRSLTWIGCCVPMKAVPIEIDWHPGLSIYASKQFLKTVGDEYGWLGGVDESKKLRCILPYTVVRKATVRMVRFRVETIPLVTGLSMDDEK